MQGVSLREGAKSYAKPRTRFPYSREFTLWADVSVEGDALDPQFLAQIGNGSVTLRHGGLCEAHLSFGKGEFPPALAAARPCGGETGHGAFPDQIALELGQSGEDTEHHAAGCCRGVDLRPLSGQHSQTDIAV